MLQLSYKYAPIKLQACVKYTLSMLEYDSCIIHYDSDLYASIIGQVCFASLMLQDWIKYA